MPKWNNMSPTIQTLCILAPIYLFIIMFVSYGHITEQDDYSICKKKGGELLWLYDGSVCLQSAIILK